jgi:hypothetical protein
MFAEFQQTLLVAQDRTTKAMIAAVPGFAPTGPALLVALASMRVPVDLLY